MSLKVGELWYELGVDDRPLERGMDKAVTGGEKKLTKLVDAAKAVGADMGRELERSAGDMEQAGGKLGAAAGDGLASLTAAARSAAREAAAEIESAAPASRSGGRQLGEEAGKGIRAGVADGASAAGRMVEDELAGIDAGGAGRRAGENVGEGVSEGFGSGVGDLADAVDVGALGALANPATAAGVALGAAVTAGFTQALDLRGTAAKTVAQIGGNSGDIERYQGLIEDIFGSNSGESIEQVGEAVSLVTRNMEGMRNASDRDLQSVVQKVLSLSSLFGYDLADSVNAASQMIRTGLVKDAGEAFDLIGNGFQDGLDKSSDMLESLNEYSTKFRDIGLTGQDVFGLISQAVKGGARDFDVAADALKEVSIRVKDGSDLTAEAFSQLGFNADDMAARFAAGGETARSALDQVLDRLRAIKDPLLQSQVAVKLFGTQAEDMGAALNSLDLTTAAKEVGDFEGVVDQAGETVGDEFPAKVEQGKRRILDSLAEIPSKALALFSDDASWGDLGDYVYSNLNKSMGGALDLVQQHPVYQALFGDGDIASKESNVRPPKTSTIATGAAEQAWTGLAGVWERARGAAEAAAGATGDLGQAVKRSGDEAKVAAIGYDALEDRAGAFADALDRTTSKDNILGAAVQYRSGLGEVISLIGKLPRSIDTAKVALGGYTDEQHDAIAALTSAGDAARSYLSTLLDQGRGSEEVRMMAQALWKEYERQFTQVGFNKDQIRQYQEILGLTDDQINTAITVSGEAEALAKIQAFQALLGPGSLPREVELEISAKIADGDLVGAAEDYSNFVRWVQASADADPIEQPSTVDMSPASEGLRTWRDFVLHAPPVQIPATVKITGVQTADGRTFGSIDSAFNNIGGSISNSPFKTVPQQQVGPYPGLNGLGGADYNTWTPRAVGGSMWPRRTYVTGEHGPELVTMGGSEPAWVTPAGRTRAAIAAMHGGGSSVPIGGLGAAAAGAGADLAAAVTGRGTSAPGLGAVAATAGGMTTEALERKMDENTAAVRTLAAMADRGDTFNVQTPNPARDISRIARRRRGDRWLTTGAH